MRKEGQNNKRVGLPKSIRFEVFKRDKFTCQYCGQKAPDVLLHIDHIEPVSKGGTNEIVNLITSCFDCNLGKSDKRLNDSSAIDKQRKQMELLQERREQIELMFEWKKSLSNLDNETIGMIKDYAHAKIKPLTINENGDNIIRTLLKRFSIEELLNAIDISATNYVKYSDKGIPTEESVENFINKLGGILFNRSLKPIDKKLSQIRNKAKSEFYYFNLRSGIVLLNQYVSALRKYWRYSDEQILEDLNNELSPKLDETEKWTDWREILELWINSIKNKNEAETPKLNTDRTEEQLGAYLRGRIIATEETELILHYILNPYPSFDPVNFGKLLNDLLIEFIKKQEELSAEELKELSDNEEERSTYIWDFIRNNPITKNWDYDYSDMLDHVGDNEESGKKLSLLMGLESVVADVLVKLLNSEYFFSPNYFSSIDLLKVRKTALNNLENKI